MSKQAYPILPLTIAATGTVAEHRFITAAGAYPGAGALAMGVNRTTVASGDKACVDTLGTAIVETGGVITAMTEVQADASGRAVASAGGVILGVALQASAGSGKFIEVMLQTQTGAKFGQVLASNDVYEVSTNGAIATSGITLIAGGTGLASLTLAAPSPGVQARIRIATISSGNVVVTTAAGVTFDGTNNTATFNAAADELVLGYKSATQWIVIENTSVSLSSV